MGAETANSHKLNGEGQTEAEAQEHFAYEQKQRRLANNRVSASPARYLACVRMCHQNNRDMVWSLQWFS